MRFITTRAHGVMDYLMGALLIAAPWVLDFARGGAETWVPVSLGAAMIMYSLMTDYEMGFVRVLSMRTHLSFDLVTGILLAVSPWLFGFADYVYLPHLIVGLAEVGAAVFTQTAPQSGARRTHSNRSAARGRMSHGAV